MNFYRYHYNFVARFRPCFIENDLSAKQCVKLLVLSVFFPDENNLKLLRVGSVPSPSLLHTDTHTRLRHIMLYVVFIMLNSISVAVGVSVKNVLV